MRTFIASTLFATVAVGAPSWAHASGHGPVYGLATPTLGEDAWSLDFAVMGRLAEDDNGRVMVRPMLSYGITEDLQLSLSIPMPVYTSKRLSPTRMMMMMPATSTVEALLGWRFHRQAPSVGARFESTAYVGFNYPVDPIRGGVDTAPGLVGGLVTGYASREIYVWVGGLYRRHMTPSGDAADHPGDLIMYSAVFGYRPPFFREELPSPDWRIFIEAVGEYSFPDKLAGQELANTGGHQILVGPTVLGLFGSWGISGGPMFVVFSDRNGSQPEETFRLGINYTYWF